MSTHSTVHEYILISFEVYAAESINEHINENGRHEYILHKKSQSLKLIK